MTVLSFLLMSAAVARLSRLITTDLIFARLRGWLAYRYPRTLGSLVQCDWCTSIWLAAGAVPVVHYWGDLTPVLLVQVGLAVSLLVGWLATVEERINR